MAMLNQNDGAAEVSMRVRFVLPVRVFAGLALVGAVIGGAHGFGQERGGPSFDQSPLGGVLESAAVYADKVKQVALFFFCTETIDDISHHYRCRLSFDPLGLPFILEIAPLKTGTKRHEYDYQMVRSDKELFEQRNPIGKSETTPGDFTQRFTASMRIQYTVYGAVGFLSRYWQNFFSYRLEGQEPMNGRKAWIVAAEPTEANKENRVRGRIWIDTSDGSVLQIEFSPMNPDAYPAFCPPPSVGFTRRIQCQIRFERVKNNIRFPSQENLMDAYVHFDGSVYPVHTSQIRFHNYRFFIVDTKVEEKASEEGKMQ